MAKWRSLRHQWECCDYSRLEVVKERSRQLGIFEFRSIDEPQADV